MNLSTMMKAAKGVNSLDEALELLSGFGVDADVAPIPLEQQPTADELAQIAKQAIHPGAKFYRVRAVMGEGVLSAFVVLQAKPQLQKS